MARIMVPSALGLASTSSPIVLDVLAVTPSATDAGTWTTAIDTGAFHNGIFSNNDTKANADNVSFTLYIPYGTYSLFIVCTKDTDAAKLTVAVDGVKWLDATDLYAASANKLYIASATSKAVSNTGLHTLLITADGKHTSSSAYAIQISAISFVRTG